MALQFVILIYCRQWIYAVCHFVICRREEQRIIWIEHLAGYDQKP